MPSLFPKLNLNLLYPQTLPIKFHARFLRWLLSFGRYIAVVVELLVLATFAARFKLDADLADLKDKINSQVPFIESLAETEALIRQTQFRLSTIHKTSTTVQSWTAIFNKISTLTPSNIILAAINLDIEKSDAKPSLKITGSSPTNADLAIFLAALRKDQMFVGIDLTNLTFDQGSIQFTITGGLK